jgi:hypothetical protein
MRRFLIQILILSAAITLFSNCKKSADFTSAPLDDYMNLQVGKYIIYRLDSTEFVNFGQTTQYVHYQAKDEIDAAIVDNLGRPGFRVFRYLRDTAGLTQWVPNSTFMIIPTEKSIEVIEDNFRYQKLMLPINEGFNWKGNSYISIYSSGDLNWEYGYLDDWDYTYENVNSPYTVFGYTVIDSTITVNQRDEIAGHPEDPNSYSQVNYSVEVYGKNLGLILKISYTWNTNHPREETLVIKPGTESN